MEAGTQRVYPVGGGFAKTQGTGGTGAQVRPGTKMGVRLRKVLLVELRRVHFREEAMVRSDEGDWTPNKS